MADIMRMGQVPGYLGSWDADEQPGRELTLTIEKIVDEQVAVNGQKETVTTIHWTDKKFKPMIINVTNKKTLCKLYKTKDTEKLKGKSVVIGVEQVKAFGSIYDALRIRNKIPQTTSAVLPKCENCGKDIVGAGRMSPEKTAAYTKDKYGKSLCAECAMAMAEAQKAEQAVQQ